MSEFAIRVEKISKLYRLGERQQYKTLRDSLSRVFSNLFRKIRIGVRPQSENIDYIWALKKIVFEINKGSVVGIIGRNGSGKTTLLKILSRITYPTEGYAEVNGRVASLLDVGIGFHPELTGRDNIYLNGAILGMRKSEIRRKFGEIVEFAELEKFIDTPVKYYSDGMRLRLAFSVAAHLESEILFVDEVLSVGDLAFQKKCLGKIDNVVKSRRTVLFVSHQMNQIRRICDHCLWLEAGHLLGFGPTAEIINAYEATFSASLTKKEEELENQHQAAQYLKWEVLNPVAESPYAINTSGPVEIGFVLKVNRLISNGHVSALLFNAEGQLMWGTGIDNLRLEQGLHRLTYRLSAFPLKPGPYYWIASICEPGEVIEKWYAVPEFSIATLPLAHRQDEWAGLLNLQYEFHVDKIS